RPLTSGSVIHPATPPPRPNPPPKPPTQDVSEISIHNNPVILTLLTTLAHAIPPQVAGLEAGDAQLEALTPIEAKLLTLAGIQQAADHDAEWCVFGEPPTKPNLTWRPDQKATIEQGKWTVRAGSPAPEQIIHAALTDLLFFFADVGEDPYWGGGCKLGGQVDMGVLKRLAATYEEQGKNESAIQTWHRIAADTVSNEVRITARLSLVRLYSLTDPERARAQLRELEAMDLSEADRAAVNADLATLLTQWAAQMHIAALQDPRRTAEAGEVYATAFALLPALADGPLGETAAVLSLP
ncbi:MAG: hypothetical protein ACI8RZ_007789, partial [Myxococcota bacterium]